MTSAMDVTIEERKILEFMRNFGPWAEFTVNKHDGKLVFVSVVQKLKVETNI